MADKGRTKSKPADHRRPAILLVHGFPLGRVLWRHLLGSDPSLLAPDLAGFAGSSAWASKGHSIARYADDMIALLDKQNIDHAIVCGLSMGGYVALEICRRYATRVHALALVSTRAEADSPEGQASRNDMIELVRRDGIAGLAAVMVPKLLAPKPAASVVAETRAMILAASPEGAIAALEAMRDRADSRPLLPQITVPTLVVAGADDQLIHVGASRTIAGGVPGAELEIIPGAGHLVPLERPKEFNRVMHQFIAKVS